MDGQPRPGLALSGGGVRGLATVGILTGFDQIPEVFASGVEAAEEALPQIRALLAATEQGGEHIGTDPC